MVLETVFLVVAVILFTLAAFGKGSSRVGFVPLGLAFFSAAILVAVQTVFPGLK
jgi:hypothetical protein